MCEEKNVNMLVGGLLLWSILRIRYEHSDQNAVCPFGQAAFYFNAGLEPEGTWQGAGGALQPEAACAAAQVKSRHSRAPHKAAGFAGAPKKHSLPRFLPLRP